MLFQAARRLPPFRLLGVLLLVAAAAVSLVAQSAPPAASSVFAGGISWRTGLLLHDDLVVALIQNSSGDLARDTVQRLSLWDRSQVTEGYGQAAEWMASRAKEIGLQRVEIERFASDGKAEYFGSGTEPLWKVKRGELWLTAPVRMKITSYEEMPMSLARNSTTADGEGDIVDVGEGMTDRDYPADVRGKIVLTSGMPSMVAMNAVVRRGALGVISYWSVPSFDSLNRMPGDHPEQVGWNGIPPAGPGQPGRFAFLVSARRGQELKAMLKQGTVRARATVEAELAPGTLDVVTGVIPGSKYADEEVVISAHMDHYKPGANDNASGSSAILEMARTLTRMIAANQVPAPLRTIRFMWVPEYSGTRAWFSKHLDDRVKRVAEFNFDMVGENPKSTNAVFTVSYLPDSTPSFLNAVTESIVDFINKFNDDRYGRRPELQALSLTGSRDRTLIRMVPYMTGTDHELFNNAGIPGTTLGVFPDDFYHSSGDSIEQVDATQLHRAVVLGLLGATTIAHADDAQAADLAWLTALYGRRRAAAAESDAMRGLLAATKAGYAWADGLARDTLPHVYRRERAAIASCAVFARTPETRRRVEQVAAAFEQDLPAAQKRTTDVAVAKAADLGVARTPVAMNDAQKRAARLFPAWVPGRQLTSINVVAAKVAGDPTAQFMKIQGALGGAMMAMRARGESELRLMGLPNAPATWVDGKRSLYDIWQAMGVEYAQLPLDTLEVYFRAFEKAGAMTIAEK